MSLIITLFWPQVSRQEGALHSRVNLYFEIPDESGKKNEQFDNYRG